MNIAGMEVYFASDLKNYGLTEDGTPFIGEVFFVEVENKRGDRWRHHVTFDGVRKEQFDEGTAFHDTRPWARAQCEKLVEAIKAAGKINPNLWHEARPAYGSNAYLAYGQADDLVWERQSVGNEMT